MPSSGLLKHNETSCRPFSFTSYQAFWKIKKGLRLVSLPHFADNFWRKIFLLLYSINETSFIVWLALLREILGNIFIAIVCKPGCDVMNFVVNLIFLINCYSLIFSYMTKNLNINKNLNILRAKRAFKVK